jgi:hypothetical protein
MHTRDYIRPTKPTTGEKIICKTMKGSAPLEVTKPTLRSGSNPYGLRKRTRNIAPKSYNELELEKGTSNMATAVDAKAFRPIKAIKPVKVVKPTKPTGLSDDAIAEEEARLFALTFPIKSTGRGCVITAEEREEQVRIHKAKLAHRRFIRKYPQSTWRHPTENKSPRPDICC